VKSAELATKTVTIQEQLGEIHKLIDGLESCAVELLGSEADREKELSEGPQGILESVSMRLGAAISRLKGLNRNLGEVVARF
jgi:hypothetical protein